jgi:hypothetical protein
MFSATTQCYVVGGDTAMAKEEKLFDRIRRIPNIEPDIITFETMNSGWNKNSTNPRLTERALGYSDNLKSR